MLGSATLAPRHSPLQESSVILAHGTELRVTQVTQHNLVDHSCGSQQILGPEEPPNSGLHLDEGFTMTHHRCCTRHPPPISLSWFELQDTPAVAPSDELTAKQGQRIEAGDREHIPCKVTDRRLEVYAMHTV
ncbi:hypothetical protein AXK59_01240 [Tsukamurella tyrosinosolvens]|nr:hypothetical protein AXK59_01240 [Tsukamurella tyrosinosolvens]